MTHQKHFLILASLIALPLFSSCRHAVRALAALAEAEDKPDYLHDSERWGRVVERDIAVKDFAALNIDGRADVVFSQGPECAVRVSANERALALYRFDTNDSTLTVWSENDGINTARTPAIFVRVTAPTLTSVKLRGAGDITLRDSLVTDTPLRLIICGAGDLDADYVRTAGLWADISGAGDLDVTRVDGTRLGVSVSGSGDANFKRGRLTDDVTMDISGAGDVDAKLYCRDITIDVSGAGDADVSVSCRHASLSATGTGDIELSGNASRLTKRRGGIGSIDTRKLSVDEIVNR